MMQHINFNKHSSVFRQTLVLFVSILLTTGSIFYISLNAAHAADYCNVGDKTTVDPTTGARFCVHADGTQTQITAPTVNNTAVVNNDYRGYVDNTGNVPSPAGINGGGNTGGAQGGGNTGGVSGGYNTGPSATPYGKNCAQGSLCNPLQYGTLPAFLEGIIQVLMVFALPLIFLMIIYAGFMYVMARGSEENITKATRMLTYAIVGGLLILGADLLMKVIQGTVSQLTG